MHSEESLQGEKSSHHILDSLLAYPNRLSHCKRPDVVVVMKGVTLPECFEYKGTGRSFYTDDENSICYTKANKGLSLEHKKYENVRANCAVWTRDPLMPSPE